MVSVVWNLVLLSTGRHITMTNARQALVPGVFFGLNLAVFFAGATHNRVANAALIGSLVLVWSLSGAAQSRQPIPRSLHPQDRTVQIHGLPAKRL